MKIPALLNCCLPSIFFDSRIHAEPSPPLATAQDELLNSERQIDSGQDTSCRAEKGSPRLLSVTVPPPRKTDAGSSHSSGEGNGLEDSDGGNPVPLSPGSPCIPETNSRTKNPEKVYTPSAEVGRPPLLRSPNYTAKNSVSEFPNDCVYKDGAYERDRISRLRKTNASDLSKRDSIV